MITNRCKKLFLLGAMVGTLSMGSAMAASFNDLVPAGDWTYEAIDTLVKHGGLTDTKGIKTDGSVQYTRAQLAPLMAYITQEREKMNDNDRETALKLYRAYKDEVMAYNVAESKRQKAMKQEEKDHKKLAKKLADKRYKADKKAQKELQKQQRAGAKPSQASGQGAPLKEGQAGPSSGTSPAPAVINDVYYGAVNPPAELQAVAPPDGAEEVTYDNEKPEEVALTPDQIKEKMKHFHIDTSPLKVGGDIRVRTQGTKGGKAKSDAKANVEMAMTW